MKIEIKNRFNGNVIFTHECENNTIKITVEAAVKLKVNLSEANLSGANLYRANLSEANLSGANLYRANLSGANLYRANLYRANLSEANILCQGDMKVIFTLQLEKWRIGFTKDFMKIGCQSHSIEKWRNFTDEELKKMDAGALDWWKKWKDFIFKAIELSTDETH